MISCIVGFEENFTKNIAYYKLMLKQITDAGTYCQSRIDEHTALAFFCDERCEGQVVSRICEGYQFVIAFDGKLSGREKILSTLQKCGYHSFTGDDAEIALSAYIHYGKECVKYLDGEYSFVVYDMMRREVSAVSENSYPLFFTRMGNCVVICTNLKNILANLDEPPRMNKDSLSRLLLSSSCNNIFEGIECLEASSIMTVNRNGISTMKYDRERTDFVLNTDRCAVVLFGNDGEKILCEKLAVAAKKRYERAVSFSFDDAPWYVKELSIDNTQIYLCETAVKDGIKDTVISCGLPIFSDTDFLLSPAFERIPKGIKQTYAIKKPQLYCRDIILKNHMFNRAVEESLKECSENIVQTEIESGKYIAQKNAMSFSSLAWDREKHDEKIGYRREVNRYLRRILASVIADDNAPINAFFDRRCVLNLCEGRVDCDGSVCRENALIAYLLKLNVWFCEFKPRIS